MRLADAIRYLRLQKDFSARGLSLKAGLSEAYVGKLEAGNIEPSVKAFGRLALVLGMSEKEIAFCVLMESAVDVTP